MVSADALAPQPTAAGSADLGEAEVRVFVDAHWDLLYRSAYFICADRWAAEDIAQEAMLKALGNLRSVDPKRPITPWLSKIAANAARDWLRKRSRRPEDELDEEAEIPTDPGIDLADSLGRNSLPDELAAALLDLDLGQRTAIVMRHLLDLSAVEIAELLGIEPATVRTRLHRGLTQLRCTLEKKEEGDD